MLRRVPTALIVSASALISVAAYAVWPAPPPHHGWHWWLYLAQHWVFFVCAERGAGLYMRVSQRTRPALAVGLVAAFVATGAILWRMDLLAGAGHPSSAVPALVLAAVGTAVSLTVFPLVGSSPWLGWARAIGRDSLGVYVSHYVILMGLCVLAVPYLRSVSAPGLGTVIPVLFTCAAAALAYATTRILRRLAPVPFLRPGWDIGALPALSIEEGAPAQAQ